MIHTSGEFLDIHALSRDIGTKPVVAEGIVVGKIVCSVVHRSSDVYALSVSPATWIQTCVLHEVVLHDVVGAVKLYVNGFLSNVYNICVRN